MTLNNGITKESHSTQSQEKELPLRIAAMVLNMPLSLPSELGDNLPLVIELDQFCTSIEMALDLVAAGEVVSIQTEQNALLLLPSLMAAQRKLHPHAYLAGVQYASTAEEASTLALRQAKRRGSAVNSQRTIIIENEPMAFDALCQLICDIAQRTITREDNSRHYWFTERYQARVAVLNLQQKSGNRETNGTENTAMAHSAIVLTQGTGRLKARSLLNHHRLLFLIPGTSEAELNQGLWALAARLDSIKQGAYDLPDSHVSDSNHPLSHDLPLLESMQQNLHEFELNKRARFVVTLQASSMAALAQEIALMSSALGQVFKEKGQYKTPAGSYFTAAPLGQQQLAFVYPGVGTVYHDMFSELHHYFPALYTRLEQDGDLKAMLQAEQIYHKDKQITQQMSLGDMAIAGVGSSYLLTKLLMDEFDISPQYALGYSMGEASMWASLDVWQQPHLLIDKTKSDPLFTSVISGELTAVRSAWGLSHDEVIEWNSFVVRCTPESIRPLLKHYPRVYLAITQGDTCVIAGCQQSCKSLLETLGKRGIAANRVTAMHTTPALSQHAKVVAFYDQAIVSEAINHPVKFISAADTGKGMDRCVAEQQGQLNAKLIATSIADTFCNSLDFTALIQSATRQGAKLFVEVGADRQNCTLIDKILKDDLFNNIIKMNSIESHSCTVPINAKGSHDITTLLKAIGQLISHRVPVSMTVLQLGLKRQLALSAQADATHDANTISRGEV